MASLATRLRAIKIFNQYDLVEDGHPFIYRRGASPNMCIVGCWMLGVKNLRFAKVPWFDHGCLSFNDDEYENWREAIAAPLAKCKKLFPKLEMVKGPWPNVWVPKVDLDAAKTRLAEVERTE